MTQDALSKKHLFALLLVFSCVLGIQLSKIQRPYTGHFATYQGTVMGGMAQNMLREDFTEIFLPKTNSIVGSGRSLHLNQYPFPSLIAAAGVRHVGGTLEFWGRFQGIVFNFLSIILVGLIGGRLFDRRAGWIATVLFALAPYTILYGQSFLSEPHALCFLLLALLALISGTAKTNYLGHVVVSAFCFSVVMTARIHWLVFYPVFLFLILFSRSKPKFVYLTVFFGGSLVLPVLWYGHTYLTALKVDNVHTSFFMQLFAQKETPNAALLLSGSYYWMLARVLIGRYFTIVLLPLTLFGLYSLEKKKWETWFVAGGLALSLLIVILAPKKVLNHDFYLYGCFPFVVWSSAYGVSSLMTRFRTLRRTSLISVGLAGYFFIAVLFFAKPLYTESEAELHLVSIAEDVREITQRSDKIIVFGDGTGIFVYYAARAAWALSPALIGKPLASYEKVEGLTGTTTSEIMQREQSRRSVRTWFEYLRAKGAAYIVIPRKAELDRLPDFRSYLESHFHNIPRNEKGYELYKLSE